MATFAIAQNNVLEVLLGQSLNGQRLLNVLHYQYDPSVIINDGDAEVERVLGVLSVGAASLVSKMKLAQCDALKWNFIRGSIVSPTRKRYIHVTMDSEGGLAEPCLPPNVSGVITKQSTVAGRGRSGRMSLGGVPVSAVSNGALVQDQITRYNAVCDVIVQTVSVEGQSTGWSPVLWSPGVVGIAPKIADAFTQFTSRVVRRRTVGQGI